MRSVAEEEKQQQRERERAGHGAGTRSRSRTLLQNKQAAGCVSASFSTCSSRLKHLTYLLSWLLLTMTRIMMMMAPESCDSLALTTCLPLWFWLPACLFIQAKCRLILISIWHSSLTRSELCDLFRLQQVELPLPLLNEPSHVVEFQMSPCANKNILWLCNSNSARTAVTFHASATLLQIKKKREREQEKYVCVGSEKLCKAESHAACSKKIKKI